MSDMRQARRGRCGWSRGHDGSVCGVGVSRSGVSRNGAPNTGALSVGVFSVVGLLLSGCGLLDEDGAENPETAEEAQESDSGESESGESQDEGAEDEGAAGEDAEDEEGAEPAESLTEDLAEGEAPEFVDLEDRLWESMLEAESVTIQGSSPLGASQLEEYFSAVAEDIDENTDENTDEDTGEDSEGEIDEETVAEISVAGAMDGSATESQIRIGDTLDLTIITAEERTYLKGEDFADITALSSPHENADFVDQELIDDLLADRWIDIGSAEEMASMSPQSLVEQWEDSLIEDPEGVTGEAEERDGSEVWVYTSADGESTYVVSAEETPRLLSIDDAQSSLMFAGWDETEGAEAPEETLTMDEVTQTLIDSMPVPSETAEP